MIANKDDSKKITENNCDVKSSESYSEQSTKNEGNKLHWEQTI